MTGTVDRYPADIAAIAKLNDASRTAFEKWMLDLDEVHKKLGWPYGDGSLWKSTGAECWLPFFEDGLSPATALAEDLSYD